MSQRSLGIRMRIRLTSSGMTLSETHVQFPGRRTRSVCVRLHAGSACRSTTSFDQNPEILILLRQAAAKSISGGAEPGLPDDFPTIAQLREQSAKSKRRISACKAWFLFRSFPRKRWAKNSRSCNSNPTLIGYLVGLAVVEHLAARVPGNHVDDGPIRQWTTRSKIRLATTFRSFPPKRDCPASCQMDQEL